MKKKQCYKCKRYKDRTKFYRRNSTTKWIAAACIECTSKIRKKNKEKQLGRVLGKRAPNYANKDIELLKEMYTTGCSYKEIQGKFPDRTQHALESKLSEAGIASRIKYLRKKVSDAECLVKIWLLDLEFTFEHQVQIDNYFVDFKSDRIIIEVQGSYFHCDPLLYPMGPKYDCQIHTVARDSQKRKYLLSKGYSVIYIWEHDIYTQSIDVKQELTVVLNSNIRNNNKPISVELLRDNAEVTDSIAKGELAP